MIVNAMPEGWEVIHQRSHALLAAQLIAPWRAANRPACWIELMAALVQHDDEENYWEGTDYLSDIGTPLNFDRVGIERSMTKERIVIANALRQGIWVALLISRHNSYIYEEQRGKDPLVTTFLDEQVANQRAWIKALGIRRADLERAYRVMGWGDRLSLILCQRQLPDKERALEIMPGEDDTPPHAVVQRADGTLALSPYPYADETVTVYIERRVVKQVKFTSTAQFRKVVEAADVERIEWIIRAE